MKGLQVEQNSPDVNSRHLTFGYPSERPLAFSEASLPFQEVAPRGHWPKPYQRNMNMIEHTRDIFFTRYTPVLRFPSLNTCLTRGLP